jgi:carbonic anhydrase/acetyltransferase-like protein (isoleucine patch superfamily)
MPLYNKSPFVGQLSWVAPNASLIGDVTLGPKSSVWYGAVLRGNSEDKS